jgi:uncharacterized protein (DUF2249 family)
MAMQTHVVDVRGIAPRERHPLLFAALDGLAEGESLLLINDHDPKPFGYQLAAERPGEFDWEYRQQGPEEWQVQITRRCC